MNEEIVKFIYLDYKSKFCREGAEIAGYTSDFFAEEQNILKYIMGLGKELSQQALKETGRGYAGSKIEVKGEQYKYKGDRKKSVHGLFGLIEYERAYYTKVDGGAGYCPQDKRLRITQGHTPAMQYYLSGFTGREAYEESLRHFHEIFRSEGKELVSFRKALDMDYELGKSLERLRQQEIKEVSAGGKPEVTEAVTRMAVSIDATKVRERKDVLLKNGKKRREILFRDAKIASISDIGWDEEHKEAFCRHSSYVSGIEHADDFGGRVFVEMERRSRNLDTVELVLIADGATWIWDRAAELSNGRIIEILDFYHACEHVSQTAKLLFGEGTDEYGQHFREWKKIIRKGKIETLLKILLKIRAKRKGTIRSELQKQINYLENNKHRMKYDQYRRKKLPVGSGTIESACKNVIGGRLKQGGMSWSEKGADGMLQIRSSLKSRRFLHDFSALLQNAA
jgi:hypothetical protein